MRFDMKRFIIFLTLALGLCSCSGRFMENYPELKLSQTSYWLGTEGGSFEFMVYYSSSWTCRLETDEADGSWIVLSRDGAPGQAYLRVTYESAEEHPRSASILISADNGDCETVILNQKAK